MRIEDRLYFAPNILFADVGFGGAELPDQFRARIGGFYLGPAHTCAQGGQAFAGGALLSLHRAMSAMTCDCSPEGD